MAKKIRGITIELGADYTELTEAFNKVTKQLSGVDKSLKDVNKLLKLDPSNVELLSQKQGYLEEAISLTAQKLEEEKKMLEALPSGENGEMTEQQKALAREIEATTLQLNSYNSQLADLEKGEQQTADATKKLGKELEETGNKSKKFDLGGLVTGLNQGLEFLKKGIGAVSKAYDELIGDSVKLADDLLTQSTVTGLSTDALQEYAYMSELVDTDVGTITGSLTKLTKQMDSAKGGSGSAAEAFKQLGITVTNSDGSLRDANEVFLEAITALGGIENQTEADALAMDIFGRSAKELNPLIDAGAETLEEYRNQAHEMGYVLDNETLGALGGIDDNIQLLKNNMDARKNQIAVALMPVVSEITDKFVRWASSVDWEKVGQTISTVVTKIGSTIEGLINIVTKIITKIKEAIDWIKKLFNTKIELPKIKLPHPYISPKGWDVGDLLKGIKPSIGIDWYAKGYDGMVLNGATIFGVNSKGDFMAGGERGAEVIIGENKLRSLLAGAGGQNINIVINEASTPEATAKAVMAQMQLAVASNGRAWK